MEVSELLEDKDDGDLLLVCGEDKADAEDVGDGDGQVAKRARKPTLLCDLCGQSPEVSSSNQIQVTSRSRLGKVF